MTECDETQKAWSNRQVKEFREKLLELVRSEKSKGYFDPIKNDFLELFYKYLESNWIDGKLCEGSYRQKGNVFRDLISELIYIRSEKQYRLLDTKVPGYTEHNHDLDLAFVRGEDSLLIVAGEVKMTGSPRHRVGNTIKEERRTQSDLDKRLKEVKFTSVDLKLYYTSDKVIVKIVQSLLESDTFDKEIMKNQWWDEWVKKSVPGFYSFWASRLASGRLNDKGNIVNADNPDLILEKFENLRKYHNAVGVFLFKEDNNGKYVPAREDEIESRGFEIDDVIDDLIKFLDRHL